MESTDEKLAPESGKSLPPPEVPPPPPPPPPPPAADCFAVDVVLRILLFASTLFAVVVMVTAKQTKAVMVPGIPFRVPLEAKFNHSPAFIYFIAALSVACLYSIITLLASFSVIFKPVFPKALLAHFAIIDVLMLGLVASATGAAGGVGYIGLRGNTHTGWTKVCNVYDTYCRHIGGALFVSLCAAILLVFLIILSIFSLSRRVRA